MPPAWLRAILRKARASAGLLSPTKATLEVIYDKARDELALSGVKFNGQDQPKGLADALVSNMCDKAKGL